MTIVATPILTETSTAEYLVSTAEARDALRLNAETAHLTRCVESVNKRIVEATGYVPAGTPCTQDLDGGGLYLFLHYRPIVSITAIEDITTQTTLDASEYEQRGAELDCVYPVGAWRRWAGGQQRFRVSYVAGTNTPPAVFRSIALAMISREYDVGKEGAAPPMTAAEVDDLLSEYYRIG